MRTNLLLGGLGRDRAVLTTVPSFANPPFVFFSAVRGPSTTDIPNMLDDPDHTDGLAAIADSENVPITWLARWDALDDDSPGGYRERFQTYVARGDEVGLWLEIIPDHCTAAGVTPNTGGDFDYAAARCTLLGYSPAEREDLIDAHITAYQATFPGLLPKTVGMWMIDPHSIAYLRDTYGIKAVGWCRNQYSTDGYEIQGTPDNTVYEPAANWLAVMARDSDRMGVAAIKVHFVDALNNFGHTGSAPPCTEPVAVQQMSETAAGYWTPLVTAFATQPLPTALRWVTAQSENGFAWATYGAMIEDCVEQAAILAAADTIMLTTASQVALNFLARSTSDRDLTRVLYQPADWDADTDNRCLEITNGDYRTRFRWGGSGAAGYIHCTDLRSAQYVRSDPHRYSECQQQFGQALVPWAVDGARFGITEGFEIRHDVPGENALRIAIFYFDGSSTYEDDAGGSSGTVAVTNVPDDTTEDLGWTSTGGRTNSVTFHKRGMIWETTRPSPAATTSTLCLSQSIAGAVDAMREFRSIGSVEEEYIAADSTNNLDYDYTGLDWFAVVSENSDAAVIYWPLTKGTDNTWYSAFAKGGAVEIGVKTTNTGSPLTFTMAVVPCSRTQWRGVLAALQSSAMNWLDGTTASLAETQTLDLLTGLSLALEMGEASGNAIDDAGSNDFAETGGTIGTIAVPWGTMRDFEAGDTEHFTHADAAAISMGDIDCTFEVWAKPESLAGAMRLFGKGNGAASAQDEFFMTYSSSGNCYVFEVANATDYISVSATAYGAPQIGRLVQIVGWRDKTNKRLGIRINDAFENRKYYDGIVNDTANPFDVGRFPDNAIQYWDGGLGRLRMWKNRVLNNREIAWLFNAGAGRAVGDFV